MLLERRNMHADYEVTAKSLSMTTASNWLLNWGIAYATPYMVDSGKGNADMGAKVFFLWGGFCFICSFFGEFLEEYDHMAA